MARHSFVRLPQTNGQSQTFSRSQPTKIAGSVVAKNVAQSDMFTGAEQLELAPRLRQFLRWKIAQKDFSPHLPEK